MNLTNYDIWFKINRYFTIITTFAADAFMGWFTGIANLFHRWQWICSYCLNYNSVLISLNETNRIKLTPGILLTWVTRRLPYVRYALLTLPDPLWSPAVLVYFRLMSVKVHCIILAVVYIYNIISKTILKFINFVSFYSYKCHTKFETKYKVNSSLLVFKYHSPLW